MASLISSLTGFAFRPTCRCRETAVPLISRRSNPELSSWGDVSFFAACGVGCGGDTPPLGGLLQQQPRLLYSNVKRGGVRGFNNKQKTR
jgi:hypothetical protein